MQDITFLAGETWHDTQEVVVFQASGSGRPICCRMSWEALQDRRFNGDASQPLETFRRHRPAIEEIARRLIQRQRFEPDGSILIRPQDC
jgi:hypothetical protein